MTYGDGFYLSGHCCKQTLAQSRCLDARNHPGIRPPCQFSADSLPLFENATLDHTCTCMLLCMYTVSCRKKL